MFTVWTIENSSILLRLGLILVYRAPSLFLSLSPGPLCGCHCRPQPMESGWVTGRFCGFLGGHGRKHVTRQSHWLAILEYVKIGCQPGTFERLETEDESDPRSFLNWPSTVQRSCVLSCCFLLLRECDYSDSLSWNGSPLTWLVGCLRAAIWLVGDELILHLTWLFSLKQQNRLTEDSTEGKRGNKIQVTPKPKMSNNSNI